MKGDSKSFEKLIIPKQESLYKIAYSYVHNQDDALDIVQEAIYKAFISISKLKQPEFFIHGLQGYLLIVQLIK